MSYVITQPEMLAAAAEDMAGIGSTINEVRAAAAGSTTSVVAAAEDEISAAIAAVFGQYAQQHQAAVATAATLVDTEFTQALAAASSAYAGAEAAARTLLQSPLGGAPTAAANIGLVMGPSGLPLPPPSLALFIEGESVLETAGVNFGNI
jgi:hypothetical protein